MAAKRTVLVTGASGVVGRAVAAQLPDCRVIGLVHSDMAVPEVDEVLRGDLASPWLGLGRDRWRRLAAEVDSIVHSGALAEWGQPAERYAAVNVEGTRAVAELAGAAGAPVHFQSTCFVHVLERGEAHRLDPGNVVTPYVTSKLAAERVLAESGVPHSVFRSTNLVGDSRTGVSARPQIVQHVSAWIARGKAPYLPVHPGNLVDVAPVDLLAEVTAAAVRADDVGAAPYWVTYGAAGMTMPSVLDVVEAHVRARGGTLTRPPVVDPDEPFPVPPERIPPRSRTFLKVLVDVSEVTRGCGGVLPTSLPLLTERFGVRVPSDTVAFRRSLDYWAAERAGVHEAVEAR